MIPTPFATLVDLLVKTQSQQIDLTMIPKDDFWNLTSLEEEGIKKIKGQLPIMFLGASSQPEPGIQMVSLSWHPSLDTRECNGTQKSKQPLRYLGPK